MASMTRSKRGTGNLAFDLSNKDGNASSRYKRPIPGSKNVVSEQMDVERSRLLEKKQAQLAKVTKRHDTLVCYIFFSVSFSVSVFIYGYMFI
jgi:hypothetical protein